MEGKRPLPEEPVRLVPSDRRVRVAQVTADQRIRAAHNCFVSFALGLMTLASLAIAEALRSAVPVVALAVPAVVTGVLGLGGLTIPQPGTVELLEETAIDALTPGRARRARLLGVAGITLGFFTPIGAGITLMAMR